MLESRMQVDVRFLDNLRLEASFDDFTIVTDQPVRYKGDGTAPGPFDYFLASSALCAAYFVKVYCKARDIPTEDIKVTQNNIIDPENRYNQTFNIQIELPADISEKDRKGILASMERCTVKRVIQNAPGFKIDAKDVLGKESNDVFEQFLDTDKETFITSKDCSLEETIKTMTGILTDLGINIEIASWRNPVPHVWSVHIRDADSPICFTNGKGASKDSALASALGEYLERISNNYFYADYYLGKEIAEGDFVHYPSEKWFQPNQDDSLPAGLMDENLISAYDNDGELRASHLFDTNSGNIERGICALPYERQSDKETVYIPMNIIGNLFVSNGMSAGNTIYEARVQCLSEIFERAVKNQIITEQITLPDVPKEVLERYPSIMEGIKKLEETGFPIVVKDASLGGNFPVMCVTLMNPKTGGVFASFGAHPKFEVALERSLTELLQGRSFEGLNDVPAPSFNEFAVCEHNNIIDHFIDSTGVISWKFFSDTADFEFSNWDFSGTTEQEFNYLMDIFKQLEKEVYIADYEELGAKACRILVPDYSEIYLPEDKEVYIADYEELGAKACRILVPDYSEIYLPEDLIWDNNNQALKFREDILSIHRLDTPSLESLVERLEESELDDNMPISELIGIAFDENSEWGQLVIGELKALIFLALKRGDEAKHFIDSIASFNDLAPERKRFYQVLNIVTDITLNEELDINDYKAALTKMYGELLVEQTIGTALGDKKFFGLTETDMNFKGLDKHLRLIESYQKLQKAKREYSK